MESGKKSSFIFLFILLVPTLLSEARATEFAWSPGDPLTTDTATDWNPCGGQILEANDEEMWIVWASNRTGNYDIFCKVSSDGGATWSNDVPLTSYQYKDDHPSIMQTANGSIWVVWTKMLVTPDFNVDLYYMTSDDGGATWSNDTRLTEDTSFDQCPSITQTANGTIWVVWQSDRIEVWDPINEIWVIQDDLYYKTSTDGGFTWSGDIRLTTEMIIVNETAMETTIVDDTVPSITQTSDDKIWIVWASSKHEYFQLFYKTSSDGGATWSNETQLTTYPSDNVFPSITQTIDGTIWVVWHSEREGNYDLFYKTSDDGGATWSNDARLTDHSNVDVAPSITQTSNATIWIVWASRRAGNYDIWYKKNIMVHDVAIISVESYPTLVPRGGIVSIDVVAANEGIEPENFTVTVFADKNATVIGDEVTIGSQVVTNLSPKTNINLTFNWNTTSTSLGNYIISATASAVNGETDLNDNLLSDSTVYLTSLLGDLDHDGDVDSIDVCLFVGAYPSKPPLNPEADLDSDGDIDSDDLVIFAGNYGKTKS